MKKLFIVIRDRVGEAFQEPMLFTSLGAFVRQVKHLPEDNFLKVSPADFDVAVVGSYLDETALIENETDIEWIPLLTLIGGDDEDENTECL